MLESAGIEKLEIVRQLNAKSGWTNNDLYRLMYKADLYELAYMNVKSKPGNMTPGTDGETIDGFSLDMVKSLIEEMRAEKYRCKPVRTVYIPKANGKKRKLGIPCIRDKIVQEVVRLILEAVYDSPHGPLFSENSHGFRRSKSCHTALRDVQRKWTGVTWFIEGDIAACFDEIDHEILIKILRKKIKDERFICLIRRFLKAGYQDLDEVRKDSLAGTPQGGIVSPILANIYLNELDEYVEQLRKELEKGEKRGHNPVYKRLQDRKLYLVKKGKTKTREFRALDAQMKKLPSMDTKDPDFVRVKYIRYADDWLVGVIGSHKLAEEIKGKIGKFLKTQLNLRLSEEKTVITSAKTEEAKFLGYRLKVGRTNKEQKQRKITNKSGREIKKRTTGMEVILKAPMDEIVKKLFQKGFCDKKGNPTHKPPWMLLDDDQIVMLYSSINRGLQQFYRPSDNWARVQRVQYILKYSLAKTLAGKRKTIISKVIEDKEVRVKTTRKGKEKEIAFYQNHEWVTKRDSFAESTDIDLVTMNLRMRTKSKLGLPCCICGEPEIVQMHHVRHIRKMTEKQAKGFTRVMSMLNRKQIPVCEKCHRRIHEGKYDGLSLKDFAYDPREANLIRQPKVKTVSENHEPI